MHPLLSTGKSYSLSHKISNKLIIHNYPKTFKSSSLIMQGLNV